MRHIHRPYFAVALLLATTLLTSCVYLRLLQLKGQLGDFDRNFAVDTSDGLVLAFKKPVLLEQDVEEFFKWRPGTRQTVNTAEKWGFRWRKERVAADAGRDPVELAIDVLFVENKLVKIQASETFFAASMPKGIALAALKSLGRAKVDKSARRADSTINSSDLETAAAEGFLTETGLLARLGHPVSVGGTADTPTWHYRFLPASSQQRIGASSGVVDVTFTLDPSTRRVLLMKGQSAFGAVVFDTRKVSPGNTGSVSTSLE